MTATHTGASVSAYGGKVAPVSAPQLSYYVVARAGQTAVIDRNTGQCVGWIVHGSAGLMHARVRTIGTRTADCHTFSEALAAFVELTRCP